MEASSTEKRIDDLSDRIGRFEDRSVRFEDKVDARFDKVDARFDKLEARLDHWGKVVAGGVGTIVVTIASAVILKMLGV